MKKEALVILSLLVLIIGCVDKTVQKECPDVQCPKITCPEQEVKTITKYVCANGSTVDNLQRCTSVYTPPKFNPILTNEEGAFIEKVEVTPACVSGFDGGQIYFEAKTIPDKVEFQVKDDGDYVTKFTLTNVKSQYNYFAICDKCYSGNFQLKPDKVYLFRMKFDFTSVLGKVQYSNEHLIDTISSDYTIKECSS